jgi:hypothetical protein
MYGKLGPSTAAVLPFAISGSVMWRIVGAITLFGAAFCVLRLLPRREL